MILSDLLGDVVRDSEGNQIGHVLDVRFVLDGSPGQLLAGARLDGLVVSPHSRRSYLGYERSDVNSPAMIKAILKWMHRGTFCVRWDAVQRISAGEVQLRAGFVRYDPRLPPEHPGRSG
ncbi:MAG: PRC-barrel domain containing protein [Cryobacterium sp.]|nr:PRC-barrel domain containing protein [Cryobacterium sp.]